ncbi:prephenate dehydratase [Corynebacterium lizhenjunii]|uniref:Prephenate dehydratase n=1 Tax=Corynebacterium lizhenjunii TaxID=2709394 RepID=A0A7T0KEV0_9CORY|nr:prephenate dehydratase [Corynebacterium lizhenjunii]QPK79031.1 prephenate dehydratase [Corynebacterium lizhenjunii]
MQKTVAYLGPQGTFTEAALLRFELGDITGLPVASPSHALAAVRAGQADLAVVAIENSVDGAVTATFDALVEGGPTQRVQVYQEVHLDVAFAIMTRPGADLARVRTLATHPVAYQQIRGWVEEHLPGTEFIAAPSNAAAAEMVAAGRADCAAAPERAAQLNGLQVHARGVADNAHAQTRFILVGPPGVPTPRTGNDTTSVVFTLPNEPGSLVGALQEFAHRGVDMKRIESRPTRREFGAYRFYADLVGHIDDAPVAEALRALWLRAEELVFVGSWPSASELGTAPRDLGRLRAADDWLARVRDGHCA